MKKIKLLLHRVLAKIIIDWIAMSTKASLSEPSTDQWSDIGFAQTQLFSKAASPIAPQYVATNQTATPDSVWYSADPNFVAPMEPHDFNTLGGHWGASSTFGTPGGTVTWSIAGAGLTNQTGVTFFTGSTVALSSFLPSDYVAQITAAFAQWASYANINFVQVSDGGGNFGVGTTANIRIGGGFIDGYSANGSVVGRAFGPGNGTANSSATNGDLVFDSGDTGHWTSALLFATALHEIGHTLGLDHVPQDNPTAVMNPTLHVGLNLQSDDIAGIRALYGNAPNNDDFAATASTTGAVTVGGSTTGNLEIAGDHDWFRVQLTAGATYNIDLQGAPTSSGTLADPLMQLFSGSSQLLASNDDGDGTLNSHLTYTAGVSGNYYIDAGAYGDQYAGTYRVSVSFVATPPPTTVRLRDFNGDHVSDFLWRHDNGHVVTWSMQNTQVSSFDFGQVDASWKIAGTGDFSGEGRSDILWRNDNGSVVTWDMNDHTYVGFNFGQVDNSWKIAGTGDFSGEGRADILWRNDNGQVVTWDMNDHTYVGFNFGQVDTSWKIAGTGDFNGDHKADILWRNDNGQVVTWDMNDHTYVGFNFGQVDASWKIAGTGDYNGDGRDDILWRNDNGQVVTWNMNDHTYTSVNQGNVIGSFHLVA